MKFTFEFSDSDFEGKGWERPLTTFWFTVNPPFKFASEEWGIWDDEYLMEQASDLESDYGVHDWHASGDQVGNWTEFGYHSYEVKQDKWEELIQKWHEWFASQGLEPGEVNEDIETDSE